MMFAKSKKTMMTLAQMVQRKVGNVISSDTSMQISS